MPACLRMLMYGTMCHTTWFLWEEELHSHYHFSYTISRKITYDDLLDLHVRSLLCYLWVLGLMGLFALLHWTSYITMCFYFLKRCKFGARLRHPKCTHIYIIYTCKHRLEDQNELASTHFSHFLTSFGKYVIIQIPKSKLPRSLFSWKVSIHACYLCCHQYYRKKIFSQPFPF